MNEAIRHGREEIVKLLLADKRTQLNIKNGDRKYSLDMAKDTREVIHKLINSDRVPDPNLTMDIKKAFLGKILDTNSELNEAMHKQSAEMMQKDKNSLKKKKQSYENIIRLLEEAIAVQGNDLADISVYKK